MGEFAEALSRELGASHDPTCAGPTECGGVFICATCDRTVGWCMGAADEWPDDCADCTHGPGGKSEVTHV